MKRKLCKVSLLLLIVAITITNVKGYSTSSKSLGNAMLRVDNLDHTSTVNTMPKIVPTWYWVAGGVGFVAGAVAGYVWANKQAQATEKSAPPRASLSNLSETIAMNKLN